MTLTDKMPLGRMLAIFAGTFVAGNVALAVLTYFLPDLPLPSSTGMILAMAAALAAGQGVAARLGRKLRTGEKAVFAAYATILNLVFAVAVFWGLLAYVGLPFTAQNVVMVMTGETMPKADIGPFLPWIIGIGAVVSFLVTFFFVGLGVSSQLKALERKAAKAK